MPVVREGNTNKVTRVAKDPGEPAPGRELRVNRNPLLASSTFSVQGTGAFRYFYLRFKHSGMLLKYFIVAACGKNRQGIGQSSPAFGRWDLRKKHFNRTVKRDDATAWPLYGKRSILIMNEV